MDNQLTKKDEQELNLSEIRKNYEELKRAGKTKEKSFEEYLENVFEYGTCQWCSELFPLCELKKELHLGFLCDQCFRAITSRGEELIIED